MKNLLLSLLLVPLFSLADVPLSQYSNPEGAIYIQYVICPQNVNCDAPVNTLELQPNHAPTPVKATAGSLLYITQLYDANHVPLQYFIPYDCSQTSGNGYTIQLYKSDKNSNYSCNYSR